MKAAILACAFAALAPIASAQPGGQTAAAPGSNVGIAMPHCGADVSAMSLYGFLLGSTQKEALEVAHCRSQGGALVDRPFARNISYREAVDSPTRYFEGENVTIKIKSKQPDVQREEATLTFIGHGPESKLIRISLKFWASSGKTFDVVEQKRLLAMPYPGGTYVKGEDLYFILLAPNLTNIPAGKTQGMCRLGIQSKLCGPLLNVVYKPGKFGIDKPVPTYSASLSYPSKMFPFVLAGPEVDKDGKPLKPSAPVVAGPSPKTIGKPH